MGADVDSTALFREDYMSWDAGICMSSGSCMQYTHSVETKEIGGSTASTVGSDLDKASAELGPFCQVEALLGLEAASRLQHLS